MLEIESSQPPDDLLPERRVMPRFAKIMVRVLAICAAILVILSRENVGPAYLDPAAKTIFWTGAVFISLFSFNRDVLRQVAGMAVMASLITCHVVFVYYSFQRISDLNFFVLTGLALVQAVVFSGPLMLVRKRYTGIWY